MKKINFILLLFTFTFSFAQDKLTFGVRAGATLPELSNFIDGNYKKTTTITPTFGAFINLKLTDKFSIQPEVLYANYKFNIKGNTNVNTFAGNTNADFDGNFNTSYATIPIFARYEIFKNLHLEAGPQFNILINDKGNGTAYSKTYDTLLEFSEKSLNELIKEMNSFGVNRITGKTSKFDYGLTGGLTYDLPIDGFSVSGRYYIGFTDLFKDVDENQGSVSSKNAAMNISVAYSF